MAELSTKDLRGLFGELNDELAVAECKEELDLVGGAVMCLAYPRIP